MPFQPAVAASSRSAAHARATRDELAFLPAALEIVETPPSPIGRAIAATIIAAVLRWRWPGRASGTIDIVASATGQDHAERPHQGHPAVRDRRGARDPRAATGRCVKAGDVLIELDPTMNAAERDHLQSDLIAAQLDIARLRAALAGGDDPLADFKPPPDARADAGRRLQRQLPAQPGRASTRPRSPRSTASGRRRRPSAPRSRPRSTSSRR